MVMTGDDWPTLQTMDETKHQQTQLSCMLVNFSKLYYIYNYHTYSTLVIMLVKQCYKPPMLGLMVEW